MKDEFTKQNTQHETGNWNMVEGYFFHTHIQPLKKKKVIADPTIQNVVKLYFSAEWLPVTSYSSLVIKKKKTCCMHHGSHISE